MKRFLLSLVAIATLSVYSLAQAPESFNYQAVVRDAGGIILNNQPVGMRLTIQQGSIGGNAISEFVNRGPLIVLSCCIFDCDQS